MSRMLRDQDAWPANQYARYLWQAFALWEDITVLAGIYSVEKDQHRKLVIARHLLVDFDSLDDLLKEFHGYVKDEELDGLDARDSQVMQASFSEYHGAVEPYRGLLKKIRNNLGAHRTAMPWRKSSTRNEFLRDEWGKWESHLTELEGKCELSSWLPAINSAHLLLKTLVDFNLDAWFNISDQSNLSFVMPVLPAGYYPGRKRKP